MMWTGLGFFAGEVRIAEPAETCRRTFRELPAVRDRADRIEGVLTEFWSGSPPRAITRMRAERALDRRPVAALSGRDLRLPVGRGRRSASRGPRRPDRGGRAADARGPPGLRARHRSSLAAVPPLGQERGAHREAGLDVRSRSSRFRTGGFTPGFRREDPGARPSSGTSAGLSARCCWAGPRSSTGEWSRDSGAGASTICSWSPVFTWRSRAVSR